ncbi:MAG TPA: hypothetical protein VF648_21320 [Pyrinomonadaceae bacterium]
MHVKLKDNPTPELIIANAERRLAANNIVNLLQPGANEFSIALTLCSGSAHTHAALVFEICEGGSLFLPNRENQIRCLDTALKYARAVLN